MAESISKRGLLLYYSSIDSFKELTNEQFGDLIMKELEWLSGKAEEPKFDDVASRLVHFRIKEQIKLRDESSEERKNRRDKANENKTITNETRIITKDNQYKKDIYGRKENHD